MAKFSLPYGQDLLEFDLPATIAYELLTPRRPAHVMSEDDIEAELGAAIGKRAPGATLGSAPTIVILPDKTRNCAAPLVLPIVMRHLHEHGVKESQASIMLANGSHVANQDDEITGMLGAEMAQRYHIAQHNCKDESELVYLGETSFGTPVSLNKQVVQTEQIVIVGTAIHHYFAGFGGGPKMVNPGCAGYETIRQNHALTIDAETHDVHPQCRPGSLDGNPVQQDIKEAMALFPSNDNGRTQPLLIETVLDDTGAVADVYCGDLYPAHLQACARVDELFNLPIARQADLVVASCGGFPKDINLIQVHKTIYNAFQAVRPGGVMLILAECSQGIGSETFLQWFDYPDRQAMVEMLLRSYRLNGTTALSLRSKSESVRIILVSSLPSELVARLGMRPAANLAEGMKQAIAALPAHSDAYVMGNASLTLPRLESAK